MAVRIITDSTSDINGKLQERYPEVEIYPLSISFDGDDTIYYDQKNITTAQFYERLSKASVLPTTSQVTAGVFKEAFERVVKEGDEVVAILLASEFSGTYQSAVMARDMLSDKDKEKIYIVDSKTVTLALASIVIEALKYKDEGLSAREIVEKIEKIKTKNRLYAVIGDLKYLKIGGRLSAASATIGEILNIMPIVRIGDGKIEVVNKCRGKKKAYKKIREIFLAADVDFNRTIFTGNANNHTIMEEFKQVIKNDLPKGKELLEGTLGAVAVRHSGPNCTGIVFFTK